MTDRDDETQPAPSVVPRRDGPLVLEGPVTLVDADGREQVVDRLFLCRCGGSATKPHCDGTHKRTGFRAPGVAPPERSS